jgi:hypothetical protein
MRYYSTKKRFVATDKSTGYDIIAVTHLLDKKYLGDIRIPYSKVTSYFDDIGAMKHKISVSYYALDSWTTLIPILDPMIKQTPSRTAINTHDSPRWNQPWKSIWCCMV